MMSMMVDSVCTSVIRRRRAVVGRRQWVVQVVMVNVLQWKSDVEQYPDLNLGIFCVADVVLFTTSDEV
jgi:hypothetical protein